MRARNLDRRPDAADRRLWDRAYERFARLVSGPDLLRPENEEEAARLFRTLTDREAERGTPAEVMLARLPRAFADALRAAVRDLLEARSGGPPCD